MRNGELGTIPEVELATRASTHKMLPQDAHSLNPILGIMILPTFFNYGSGVSNMEKWLSCYY